jgi:SpoVK/Ycf46/Vps4 family AAA+-type ATPase
MNEPSVFDRKLPLPDDGLTKKELTLLGFEERYLRVRNQLNLLLNIDKLMKWNQDYHKGQLAICELVSEQYPLAVFFGDVGTGKTATAECLANRLVRETGGEDSILFKLSNRVRGTGRVGEMGTLLSDAFQEVRKAAGRERRSILIIDEGDSLAASRSQEHSHHEDKVAVNTLIQGIDDLRRAGGRIVTILCTNRMASLDPALVRRAAVIEEFKRPTDEERRELFMMDLRDLGLTDRQIDDLVQSTGPQGGSPTWTYSDIRTRLYPAALAAAFPDRALEFDDLKSAAGQMVASPVIEDSR